MRAEFFGDEIDSMGLFDVSSQRRTVNLREAEILPASEVLPQFAPGGFPGLLEALDGLIARVETVSYTHLPLGVRILCGLPAGPPVEAGLQDRRPGGAAPRPVPL